MDKYKSSFFHGIMFHHFHDEKNYIKSQGSITKDILLKIIKYIGIKNILKPDEFIDRLHKNKLSNNHFCLTFDDGLRCHYDIANEVLDSLKLKGFYFIYTSVYDKNPNYLELFRYFRNTYYENINDFYNEFFDNLNKDKLNKFFKSNKSTIRLLKRKFPHFSTQDIEYRIIRDNFISKNKHDQIMFKIINKKKITYKTLFKNLFLNKNQILELSKSGNKIGLHSHSHSVKLHKMSYTQLKKDYVKNFKILKNFVKDSQDINSISHPFGKYNNDSKKILNEMNIKIGFKQIMNIERNMGMKKINNSIFEIARQDHSYFNNKI